MRLGAECTIGFGRRPDGDHRREPDLYRYQRLIYPDRQCDQLHAGDADRFGWQQL